MRVRGEACCDHHGNRTAHWPDIRPQYGR
jgi:hypothetical protein